MQFTIRTATSDDSAAVRHLVGTVLKEYGMCLNTAGIDSDLADVEASYARCGGCFLVVVDESGRVAGSGGIKPKGPGVVELRKMYLLPEARGQGLGKRMLRLLLDEAHRGFTRVELETARVLKEAIAMYESHGFKEMEYDPSEHDVSRCDRAFGLDL